MLEKSEIINNSDQERLTKLNSMKSGGRTVLTPKESITHENCEAIKDQIDTEIEKNKTEIIMDCKSVPYLDSAALELLLKAHDGLKSQGGALKLVGLNPVCRDILVATRLINELNIYEDIHKAVMGRS